MGNVGQDWNVFFLFANKTFPFLREFEQEQNKKTFYLNLLNKYFL